MAKKREPYPSEQLKVEIRHRGGYGKAAKWEWSLYREGEPLPVESGTVIGARDKASNAAREAEMRRIERAGSPD